MSTKKPLLLIDDKPENLMALKSILDLPDRNYKLFIRVKLYKFCLRKGFVNTCRCPNA
jgi:hypothetical protein